MAETMRITAILLKDYRQFRSFYLPLVDPNTGEALTKVCLIGANATGKSTLLALIAQFLEHGVPVQNEVHKSFIGFRVQLGSEAYYIATIQRFGTFCFEGAIETNLVWQQLWKATITPIEVDTLLRQLPPSQDSILEKVRLQPNSSDLAIYATPDGTSLVRSHRGDQLVDLPYTNLSTALELFKNLPAFHRVAYDQVEEFWNFLIYQIKKRENDFQIFLNATEVQSISVAQARQQFNATYPEILTGLATQWNLILERAGLAFDTQSVKIPVQLNENLEAYIKLKATQEAVPYNLLSSGIRNFIFRFGHIYALYFNRTINRGFLLLDEPELSLFPDLLYDIIERYASIIEHTQFMVATHSPVIAAQFRAEERFILEFDEHGAVHWRSGVSPEGDDPNDLLLNDFGVRSLYGKKGIEQWERFLALRRTIAATKDPATKRALLDEYTQIGNAYNFAPDEIPT